MEIRGAADSASTRGGGALSRDTCGVSWGVSTLSVIVRMHSGKIRHTDGEKDCCVQTDFSAQSETTVANVHP